MTSAPSSEKVIVELSVEETNKVRTSLGLKPLNVSNVSNVLSKSNDTVKENDEVIELSIEETNNLRCELGLMPLKSKKTEFNHVPARNLGREKEIEDRVEDAKVRREVEEGIKRFCKDGSDSNEKEDLRSWAERMRKEKKLKGDKSEEIIPVKEKKKKRKLESSCLKVPEKANEGMILTLKDEEILDRDERDRKIIGLNKTSDSLEHASWFDEKKSREHRRNKKISTTYRGFEDVDEEEFEEEVPSKVDLKINIASDYMTREEEMKYLSSSEKKSQLKAQKKLQKMFKKRKSKTKQHARKEVIKEEISSSEDENELVRRKDKYSSVMEKANIRTAKAFQSHIDEEDEEDDAFLQVALNKARRLAKLKEQEQKRGADAVLEALKTQEISQKETLDNSSSKGVTFEIDPTREFTRALRARSDSKKETHRGVTFTAQKRAPKKETILVKEKPIQTKENLEGEEELPLFGTTAPVGRGLSNVLSLLRSTGDISKPHASKEKLRGRAKDERNYENCDALNLDSVVTISKGAATPKDLEYTKREVKLEYRDEFGRLLTPKEAFRQMCYQFHGHASSKKHQEKRLKQIKREQEEHVVYSSAEKGTLGALKVTQKATGKAFVVHKT